MSFSVRRVEDPTIYVRRNKPDILGISNVWDNIANFKDELNRLEDDVSAANKRYKPLKKPASGSLVGPALKEISSETQQFGKVTRFQLLGNHSSLNTRSKHQGPCVEIKTRTNTIDPAKIVPVSDISTINRETHSDLYQDVKQGPCTSSSRNTYSPNRYTANSSKNGTRVNKDTSSFFKTTVVDPVVLNETNMDSFASKESSLTNSIVNSSANSQQFSLASSPSFHGKAVLAKSEAALAKIKEKVQKQKAMLSKEDDDLQKLAGNHKLHDRKDNVITLSEPMEKTEVRPVPLKRKVGSLSSSGPAYKGFNSVPAQNPRKTARINSLPKKQPFNANKPLKESKQFAKDLQKPEPKRKKGKVTRIVGSRQPKEVITTTSWRQGQATVKKILGARKAKSSTASQRVPEKKEPTFSMSSPDDEEMSEGLLSDEDDNLESNTQKDRMMEKQENDIPKKSEGTKTPDIVPQDENLDNEHKLKDVLSTEAQSMLVDLAQDSSESESEIKEDEKPKTSGLHKKTSLTDKRPRIKQKHAVDEERYPKEKVRHYDQNEVQKYMAQQIAERKKKQKQEKMLKKKQEEEKQRRLKDLYERQKKSFAQPKKEKRLGQTFSCGSMDVRIPTNDEYLANNEVHVQIDLKTSQNESDKENTDVDEMQASRETSFEQSTDVTEDDSVSSTDGLPTAELPIQHVVQPSPSLPLSQRDQRLTALKATALALQSRLQSQALRLGGMSEPVARRPVSRVVLETKQKETGFQGVLPGVANIRTQADNNEKQSNRIEAATKIQAAYRGHSVRKRFHWNDGGSDGPKRKYVAASTDESQDDGDHFVVGDVDAVATASAAAAAASVAMVIDDAGSDDNLHTGGSADDIEYTAIRPLYTADRINGGHQLKNFKSQSSYSRRPETTAVSSTHFSLPSVKYQPKGDRFSVMNIFSRRHPVIAMQDIFDDHPGSETASLLNVGAVSRDKDQDVEYEDDFTDEDVSTASALTDRDLKQDSPAISKMETYSECFESDDGREASDRKRSSLNENEKDMERRDAAAHHGNSGDLDSTLKTENEERGGRPMTSLSSDIGGVVSPQSKDGDMVPIMASTMHPELEPSSPVSLSDGSEPIRSPVFIRPVKRTGGNRLSPDSLQRRLTAEINLLENMEDSVRQVNDIEKTRAVSLVQQESVSLAQIIKSKQQSHEQELQRLRMKAKDEAFQAAKDLEKTRQAAAMAAASATEKLAEVQSEVIKANVENSRKYVEEASKMASGVLSNTSQHLAQFCRDLTTTTSAAVQELHKMRRPTTTLVERATSFSEDHARDSEENSRTDEHASGASDVYSVRSKSRETSPSVTSGRPRGTYSSDEFDSDKSQTPGNEESDVKTEPARSASLSVDSVVEELPDKTASDEDTTIHEESANDTQSVSTEKPEMPEKKHRPVSPLLDYSSQLDDSSYAPTDDDMASILPSREHRLKSIKRIMDKSFDEEKGKEKAPRTPFESDDSFGKFTVDFLQQYMREEEVRTKHQAAILRLREKSLKEKTKTELQWLEQLKKQSRNKGSDDVMPSIKKRERGILMKLKAEEEEIKCLKAANRAASFQRRFMIYQQQEIHRLHQATMNIRERLQKDASKRSSQRISPERSQSSPKTSFPLTKSTANTQSSPTVSLPKMKRPSRASITLSPSAKSVSEDISEELGTSHASPAGSESPFPSYITPKTEASVEGVVQESHARTRGQSTEPETSSILNMLSVVDSGGPELSSHNGESLLKIQKMLVERRQKLVKDESEVNIMLQKVTEMLNNQRNSVTSRSPHGNLTPESIPESAPVSGVNRVKASKQSKDSESPVASSIPEDISSVARTISEDIKESSGKRVSEYENCTFESDENSPSRQSTLPQASRRSSGALVEEELLSLTETSDHSDYEERIRKLKEELHREKIKAEALEKKKRKMKRSAMRKEVLHLEKELKNTREDIHRKRTEIKTAAAVQSTTTPTPPSKKSKSSQNLRKESPAFLTLGDGETQLRKASPRRGGSLELLPHEVEESLIEVLESPRASSSFRDSPVTSPESLNLKQRTSGSPPSLDLKDKVAAVISVSLSSQDKSRVSPVSNRQDADSVPEEISEHLVSDSRSATSIPEESGMGKGGRNLASQASEIPEEISEGSSTKTASSRSIRERSPVVVAENLPAKSQGGDDVGPPYTGPRSSASIPKQSGEKTPPFSDGEFEHSYTEPRSSTSISEHIEDADEISLKTPDEVLELSYTKPRTSTISSDESPISHAKSERSTGVSAKISERQHDHKETEMRSGGSDVSEISENLPAEESDRVSEKSRISSEKTRSPRTRSQSPEISRKSEADSRANDNDIEESRILSTASNHDENSVIEAGISAEPERNDDLISTGELHDGKSRSQVSSVAEEIASAYEDENVSEAGKQEGESSGLTFGDRSGDDKPASEREESREEAAGVNAREEGKPDVDYTDSFADALNGALDHVSSKRKVTERISGEEENNKERSLSARAESFEPAEMRAERVGAKDEPASQEPEEEQPYSEDFEVDDETVSEDIPEVLEFDKGEAEGEEEEEEEEDGLAVFSTGEERVRVKEAEQEVNVQETGDEVVVSDTRTEEISHVQGVADNITDQIYHDIMKESVDIMSSKHAKSKQISGSRVTRRLLAEQEEQNNELVVTDRITKNLLADAILQMVAIKRRKESSEPCKTPDPTKEARLSDDLNVPESVAPGVAISTGKGLGKEMSPKTSLLGVLPGFSSVDTKEAKPLEGHDDVDPPQRGSSPPRTSPTEEDPTATSPLGVLPGLGAVDEQTVVTNALLIAKSNQAIDDTALRAMDEDIEGLLGTPLDDSDEDFPVNENKFTDIPSDDTEPSVHEYSPMLAVPHNVDELTSLVNSTMDVLVRNKQSGVPLDNCELPAQRLDGETENEVESRSLRSYRNLIFDLTKEVYLDTVCVVEASNLAPWERARWKGGQKLSRNFKRWKSDEEVREAVLERVTNLVGLGVPRTTIQSLQRKTPVRGTKKDNVDAILIEELRQEEPQWTDYEEDETAVKFQVADAILNTLLDDTVRVFNAIEAKRNIPDNLLVV